MEFKNQPSQRSPEDQGALQVESSRTKANLESLSTIASELETSSPDRIMRIQQWVRNNQLQVGAMAGAVLSPLLAGEPDHALAAAIGVTIGSVGLEGIKKIAKILKRSNEGGSF